MRKKLNSNSNNGSQALSISYVKTMLIIIKSAYYHATSETLDIKMLHLLDKDSYKTNSMNVLDEKTVLQLENHCSKNVNYESLGIMLGCQAGLRIGEICALKWGDIDLNNRIIYVRHSIIRVKGNKNCNYKSQLVMDAPKSNTSCRLIPVTEKLNAILLKMYKNNESVFLLSGNDKFISPRTFEYRFHKYLQKIEFESFNFHKLRHTFATRCIENEVEFKALSEILGHADVSTTLKTYVHLTIESKRNQLEKLNK